MSMEINFLKLIFTLQTEVNSENQYILFGIRRDFQQSFLRESRCSGAGGESVCNDPGCPYCQVFSQKPSTNPLLAKRFQKPSLPFSFDLTPIPPCPNRGSILEIGLSLMGTAVNHVQLFICALSVLFDGRQGGVLPARILSIDSLDYSGNRIAIAAADGIPQLDRLFIHSLEGLESSAYLPTDSLTILFRSPIRILRDGRPIRGLTFNDLAMSLLRRMSSLAYYYSFVEMNLDYGWLSRLSKEVVIADNALEWADWGGNLGGVCGSARFVGPLSEYQLALLFGEFFNAGKGAAFGLGSYRLLWEGRPA